MGLLKIVLNGSKVVLRYKGRSSRPLLHEMNVRTSSNTFSDHDHHAPSCLHLSPEPDMVFAIRMIPPNLNPQKYVEQRPCRLSLPVSGHYFTYFSGPGFRVCTS